MISGSFPPIQDGVGDYTGKLLEVMRRQFTADITLITTKTLIPSKLNSFLNDAKQMHTVTAWDFRSIRKIIRLIRRKRPHVVHIQYPALGYGRYPWVSFLPLVVRLMLPSTKVIATIHEFSGRSLSGKLRTIPLIVFSHRVIVVTSEYYNDIRRFWPQAVKKLVEIPVGSNITPPEEIDGEELKKLRDTLGFNAEDIVVCYFGVVRPRKGLETLLGAFRLVKAPNPQTKLLIAGHVKDEEYKAQLLFRYSAEPAVIKSIHFTGSCPSNLVSKYLMLADICVLPFDDGVTSKRSSFICAMQHGLPTITTWSKHMPSGLVDRHNVILVRPKDEKALAEAIIEIASNAALRATLSRNAREFGTRFSWEAIAEKTWAVYREVCSSS